MCYGMSNLVYLLLLGVLAVGAAPRARQDNGDSTTRRTSESTDALVEAAVAQSLAQGGDVYDQRQDGDVNVHLRVDNATLYFVLLNGLGELVWRKGHKNSIKSAIVKKALGLKVSSKAADSIPLPVSASPQSSASVSIPTTTSDDFKPPRSTYKPPDSQPEQIHSTVLEVVSQQPLLPEKNLNVLITTTATSQKVSKLPDQQVASTSKPAEQITIASTIPSQPTSKIPTELKLAPKSKSQARSEEQLSILNLLKRTAALTAHTGAAKRHQSTTHHNQQP